MAQYITQITQIFICVKIGHYATLRQTALNFLPLRRRREKPGWLLRHRKETLWQENGQQQAVI